jgi:tRNA A-37 threonylcarbamoyl transferase component Bud32
VSSAPSQPQQGAILHRLCPQCDVEIVEERTTCETCGSKLVEIRDEIDTIVGTVVDGRFEMRAKLGQGGMGTVYRAWQKSVGREIAVKLIDRSYSRDAMAVRRFLREARLASQLSQPNTVSVFDFGQVDDGRLFIAMELIRGKTLHQVVQTDGAFSTERTVRIGVQICDALEAAHGLGIVHRDLKLENVIVLEHPPGRDLLKVLDFGLAKNIRDPGSRATESGIVVGTPRYMSPEASTAGVTGSAGDLYSLGVILGELATGKPLWTGETLPELISQKLDPTPVLARVPQPLRGVIEELLDPDPDRRPTAEATRALLIGIAGTEPSGDSVRTGAGATPTPPPQATRQLTPGKLATAKTEMLEPPVSTTSLASVAPQSRRWLLTVIGLVSAGVVVAAVVLASRGGRRTDRRGASQIAVTPAEDAAAPVPDAAVAQIAIDATAATVAAPEEVTIRVESQPRGATVTYLGTSRTAPFELRIARGTTPIELHATLAGRQPKKLVVVPDDNKTQVIKLSPRATASDEEAPF